VNKSVLSVYDGTSALKINPTAVSALRAAIYLRLSKDDLEREGDSASIQNQRALLEHHCESQVWEVVAVYVDDGYTGLNMNRPIYSVC